MYSAASYICSHIFTVMAFYLKLSCHSCGSAAARQPSQVVKQEHKLCQHKPPTHIQAELSQVAIIRAYVCFPAFIFCVALKWRQPIVFCNAVHFEPANCVNKHGNDFMTFCNAQVKTYMCMDTASCTSCTEGACYLLSLQHSQDF